MGKHQHGTCHVHDSRHHGGWGLIRSELRAHLPFTLLATIISVGIAFFIGSRVDFQEAAHRAGDSAPASSLATNNGVLTFLDFFHVAHPAHVLFSAAATTAMFLGWAPRRYVAAVILGLAGSLGLCTLSDVLLPHAGALAFGAATPMHLCLVERPDIEILAAFAGVAGGMLAARFVRRSTFFSHSAHVFISALASVFYLFPALAHASGGGDALLAPALLAGMIATLIVAVLLPCCASDVVLPLLFARPHHAPDETEPPSPTC